jgi:hypothetical protein
MRRLGAILAAITLSHASLPAQGRRRSGPIDLGAQDAQRFTIAWQQTVNSFDEDIHGAMLTWDGVMVPVGGNSTFPIDTSTARDTLPQASSPTIRDGNGRRRILAVYERASGASSDIAATCFDDQGAILARANLSALENDPVRLAWPQRRPAVDSDGVRFAVAYDEVYQNNTTANDLDTRMSLVALAGSNLMIEEAGAILGFSGNREFNVQVASRFSADGTGSRRYCTANDRDNTNSFAIDARTYDGTPPAAIGRRAIACGSQSIAAVGSTRIGGSLTYTTSPTPPLVGFLVGAPVSAPMAPCPGCTIGASGDTLLGASMTITIPLDLGLIGAVLAVQGFAFDPLGGPCLGQIHLSDAIDIVVQ